MDLRLAQPGDLIGLKAMYERIVDRMNRDNIPIWDEIYPCAFFGEDIEKGRLYILEKDHDIAAAFVLCESNDGESSMKWESQESKALYLDRFGVNVSFRWQGVGRAALRRAMELAREKGAGFLRLFVVDINRPAISLYLKHGFRQVEGLYTETFDDVILREYGFEADLSRL